MDPTAFWANAEDAAEEEELGSEDDARSSDEEWGGELYDTGEGRDAAANGEQCLLTLSMIPTCACTDIQICSRMHRRSSAGYRNGCLFCGLAPMHAFR